MQHPACPYGLQVGWCSVRAQQLWPAQVASGLSRERCRASGAQFSSRPRFASVTTDRSAFALGVNLMSALRLLAAAERGEIQIAWHTWLVTVGARHRGSYYFLLPAQTRFAEPPSPLADRRRPSPPPMQTSTPGYVTLGSAVAAFSSGGNLRRASPKRGDYRAASKTTQVRSECAAVGRPCADLSLTYAAVQLRAARGLATC